MLMLLNTVVGVCSSESDEEAFVSRFIMNLEILIFQMSLRLFFIESRLLLLLKKYFTYIITVHGQIFLKYVSYLS